MVATRYGTLTSISSCLTTEMNSLANASNCSASSEIDNSSNKYPFIKFNLSIAAQGSARTAGGGIGIYIVEAADGASYPTANQECDNQIWFYGLDAATTARPELSANNLPAPPGKFKVYVRNNTGQSLASSANILEYQLYDWTTT